MLRLRDWIDINKIDWFWLPLNPNAIELLKENQDKINWCNLSKNPNIFTNICIEKNYNYIEIKENFKNIRKEINANIFNSKNIEKWNDLGFSENVEMLKIRDWLNKNKLNWKCLINSDMMETIEK